MFLLDFVVSIRCASSTSWDVLQMLTFVGPALELPLISDPTPEEVRLGQEIWTQKTGHFWYLTVIQSSFLWGSMILSHPHESVSYGFWENRRADNFLMFSRFQFSNARFTKRLFAASAHHVAGWQMACQVHRCSCGSAEVSCVGVCACGMPCHMFSRSFKYQDQDAGTNLLQILARLVCILSLIFVVHSCRSHAQWANYLFHVLLLSSDHFQFLFRQSQCKILAIIAKP